jgi:hypothetical protein
LIGKWILCDALWVPGRKEGEFCIQTRQNEKYYLKEYGKTMIMPTLLIPPLIKRI